MADTVKPPSVTHDKLFTRWGSLKTERSSFIPHYQDLSRYLLPRSGRFFLEDNNSGRKKHNNILDSTGTRSLRVQSAGLLSGMTSPARPWMRLATPDEDLNKVPAVKLWLSQVTRTMLAIFAKSNTYRALHSMYEELGCFGTTASILLPDFQNVIHHYPLTAGEYCLATDWRGNTNTLYREFRKTVGETVKEFGRDKVCTSTRNLFDAGQLDQWVTIIHAMEPREDRDLSKRDAINMKWRSCYFELNGERGKYLSESGFRRFRAIAARWFAQGGDVYGGSPGMDALGDLKQLQHQQMRKGQAIDFMINPPLQVPMGLKDRDVDRLPGGITFYDGQTQGIKSMFDVRLDLSHLHKDIMDVHQRIREAFSADLFLMLANDSNPKMTATEVAERHEEKLLMLGPVLDRLHSEMLSPLIEMTFDQMIEAGIVPAPPEELHGMKLDVEFVSMLAQAQRAIATNSVDRFVANLGQVASFKPEVLDKLDSDVWVDKYSDMLGIDPEMIVANDKVAIVRQAREQQKAAAQQAAQAEQMASAAQKAGTVPTQGGGSNLAVDMMNQFTGYGSPNGVGL